MEHRLNILESPIASKMANRVYSAAKFMSESTLSDVTQQLVMLRVSQINGCGYCVDITPRTPRTLGKPRSA